MRLVAFIAHQLARLDPPPIAPDPSLRPVVLVHGIFSRGADMERLARHLRAIGRRVLQPTLQPNHGGARLEDLSEGLATEIDRAFGKAPVDIAGFSMGGLVARHYIQRRGGLARTGRFVTMAAPHRGTQMARIANLPGWVQMRPGSDFLRDLDSDADLLRPTGFTSFYTPLDMIIVPATSSVVPFAKNVRLLASMHPSFILERRCIRTVAEALGV